MFWLGNRLKLQARIRNYAIMENVAYAPVIRDENVIVAARENHLNIIV